MKTCLTSETLVRYNEGSNYKRSNVGVEIKTKTDEEGRRVLITEKNDYCIAVDWLELFCQSKNLSAYIESLCLQESEPEKEFTFNNHIKFIYAGHGTKLFRYLLTIKVDNIPFAEIQVLPRKVMGVMTQETILFKVINYHLYRTDWTKKLTNVLSELDILVLNITRLDIAIDNVNHIKNFMIDYIRQEPENMQVIYAGKSEISYKKMDYFLNFQSIQIGSASSEKHISIYNKANEIKKSNKDYIKTFWANNLLQFDENEVYRIELRLKSKCLKEIENLFLSDLEKESTLIELFKIHSKNLLDFRIKDDSNISRCTPITILTLTHVQSILNVGKVKYIPNDVYKAKLSIHLIYKLLASNELNYGERYITKETVKYYMEKYNLRKWFENRKDKWSELYGIVRDKL